MGFAHGWFRMVGGNRKKEENWKNMGKIGLLRRNVDLNQGVGYPHRGEAKVPKWHPSGTPRCSKATPRPSYCSQRAKFWILFRNSSFYTPIV